MNNGVRFLAFVLALAAGPASAQAIYSNGFDQAWPATRGDVSTVSSGCHTGPSCGRASLSANAPQQSVLWEKGLSAGGDVYASAWFRFPAGYTWDGVSGQSTEHKMLIVNRDGNNTGRVLLNLRGGGNAPELQLHFERLNEPADRGFTGVAWPSDGGWHRLELQVNPGRGRVWLDGNLVTDQSRATCGSPCSDVVGIQLGAYVNQGTGAAKTFFVDDFVFATQRGATGTTPPPANDARAEALEAIAQAVEALERATTALEQ